MKKISFIKHLSACVLIGSLLCACSKEEDFDAIYGSGSPLAENIMTLDGHIYEYNAQGLVTKITRIDVKTDDSGNETTELITVATISYPRSDRAVMDYIEELQYDGLRTVYTFAFGENHFANRVIDANADGETWMTKFSYDNEGHVTSIKGEEDRLRMEWTNGNLTKIQQDEYNASAVLTYGSQTGFERYNMSPFLLDVPLGPWMQSLDWWYERGLKYALYIGFLGKPCRNLPETMISYDNQNSTPEQGSFSYSYYEYEGVPPFGLWSYVVNP